MEGDPLYLGLVVWLALHSKDGSVSGLEPSACSDHHSCAGPTLLKPTLCSETKATSTTPPGG